MEQKAEDGNKRERKGDRQTKRERERERERERVWATTKQAETLILRRSVPKLM